MRISDALLKRLTKTASFKLTPYMAGMPSMTAQKVAPRSESSFSNIGSLFKRGYHPHGAPASTEKRLKRDFFSRLADEVNAREAKYKLEAMGV